MLFLNNKTAGNFWRFIYNDYSVFPQHVLMKIHAKTVLHINLPKRKAWQKPKYNFQQIITDAIFAFAIFVIFRFCCDVAHNMDSPNAGFLVFFVPCRLVFEGKLQGDVILMRNFTILEGYIFKNVLFLNWNDVWNLFSPMYPQKCWRAGYELNHKMHSKKHCLSSRSFLSILPC